jgi:high-affinity iron transporter
MIQAFVITLREGLEAFLIVAISLAYLKKTGRHALLPAVHWGIAVSVALSIFAGVLLARANNQALWEGVLAIAAALLVASLMMHMWRAGKKMKREIEGRLEASSIRVGRSAFLGVFGFTLLMITREGMETALLMTQLIFQVTAVFLLVFVVQLLIYGFHELAEANVLPNSQPLHDATEAYGPDGIYGQYLTYLLVLLPLAWLGIARFVGRGQSHRSQTA